MLLKDLRIKNFRLLKDLAFERLGHINLLVGKNNVGKSTVLEALRIYAAAGSPKLLQTLQEAHDETDQQWFENFFPDNTSPQKGDTTIYIGRCDADKNDDYLTMQYVYYIIERNLTENHSLSLQEALSGKRIEVPYTEIFEHDVVRARFKIETKNQRLSQPKVRNQLNPAGVFNVWADYLNFDEDDYLVGDKFLEENAITLPCVYISSQLMSTNELKDKWSRISLTPHANVVIKTLQMINPKIQALAFIKTKNSDEELPYASIGQEKPVPVKREGEGVLRLLQLILGVIDAKNGFLLIDEFENGLYYGIQPNIWSIIMNLAKELNVQVFATTHSWDCVKSFQLASEECTDLEVFLFRLGISVRTSDKGEVIASVYDRHKLSIATQAELEVR